MHFTEANQTQSRCQLCKLMLSFRGWSTSNMRRHLNSKHPTALLQEDRQDSWEQNTTAAAQSTSALESHSFDSLASNSTSATITTRNDIGTAAGQSQPSKKRQRQTSMVGFVSKPMPPLQQSKIDNTLVTMIATDFQPFSIVDDKGFREYTKALNPSYILGRNRG